ncbi:MAG: energy-coupled thiamine transporter ThiT [Christensenellales bacterium]
MNENNIVWIMAGVIALAYVLLYAFAKKTPTKVKAKSLAYAGVMVALSFGLSYIKIFSMPQGGSLTLLSMLPIMLYAYMFGPREGLVAAAAYSVLQCVQGVFFLNFLQFLFDYIIGFTLLGLAGLFHKSKIRINLNVEKAKKSGLIRVYEVINDFPLALVAGMTIGFIGRYLASVVAGYVFWADYAPPGQHPLIYSVVYNSILLADGLIAVAGGVALMYVKPLRRQIENAAK